MDCLVNFLSDTVGRIHVIGSAALEKTVIAGRIVPTLRKTHEGWGTHGKLRILNFRNGSSICLYRQVDRLDELLLIRA